MTNHQKFRFGRLFALAAITCMTFNAESKATETRVAGELFSKITMSEVITNDDDSSQPTSASSVTSEAVTILGTQSLSRFLTQSNIKHDVQRNQITVGPQQTDSEQLVPTGLLVRLTVDADSKRVDAELPIRSISETDSGNGTSLMQLLRKTSQLPRIQLVIRDNELILATWMTNQNVTESIMLASIERLENAYKLTKTLAKPVGAQLKETPPAETPSTKKPANKEPSVKSAAILSQSQTAKTQSDSKVSFAGTWSAKTSPTDGWAVRFDTSGTYMLVHTNNRKSTVSKGTYQVDGQALMLTESNGTKLSGAITSKNADAFTWSLRNKAGLVTMTLNFKATR